eukprot:TRINITY_DN121281_c0_g1_i1.p1 TRINITY_DN121281_c0_g1~~TRINITY_DN121281_c0_g1_i1.p1  ORF type:complete len:559 (-),score=114.84 TRINITY_DN121281_c0_g1_i1:432-2036(-)
MAPFVVDVSAALEEGGRGPRRPASGGELEQSMSVSRAGPSRPPRGSLRQLRRLAVGAAAFLCLSGCALGRLRSSPGRTAARPEAGVRRGPADTLVCFISPSPWSRTGQTPLGESKVPRQESSSATDVSVDTAAYEACQYIRAGRAYRLAREHILQKRGASKQLVLLRHGVTENNKKRIFTGWMDVNLEQEGYEEAFEAGKVMHERLGPEPFDVVITSDLIRTHQTADSVLEGWGAEAAPEIIRDWRLNERHYGNLQRLHKEDPSLHERYGREKVMEWRRSFYAAPPPMEPEHPDYDLGAARGVLTESLEACQQRVAECFQEVIAPRMRAGQRVLVVGHANTLRAMIKGLDDISDDNIVPLTVPNGIPILYHLEDQEGSLKPVDPESELGWRGDFLVTEENFHEVSDHYEVHSDVMRGLFEFVDQDNDGYLEKDELRAGIDRFGLFHAEGISDDLRRKLEHVDAIGFLSSLLDPHNDLDGDGRISWEEFACAYHSPVARYAMHRLYDLQTESSDMTGDPSQVDMSLWDEEVIHHD